MSADEQGARVTKVTAFVVYQGGVSAETVEANDRPSAHSESSEHDRGTDGRRRANDQAPTTRPDPELDRHGCRYGEWSANRRSRNRQARAAPRATRMLALPRTSACTTGNEAQRTHNTMGLAPRALPGFRPRRPRGTQTRPRWRDEARASRVAMSRERSAVDRRQARPKRPSPGSDREPVQDGAIRDPDRSVEIRTETVGSGDRHTAGVRLLKHEDRCGRREQNTGDPARWATS